MTILENGSNNSIYNIGSGQYLNNVEIANKILKSLNLDSIELSL